jgi:hypothetical protein
MADELHIVLNPVREDRTADFEKFLTDKVTPAVRAQQPELDGRWECFRSGAAVDGVVTYVLLLRGGNLEDWDLGNVLPAHYGEDEAQQMVADWLQTSVPLGTWAEAAVKATPDENQLAFSTVSVPL